MSKILKVLGISFIVLLACVAGVFIGVKYQEVKTVREKQSASFDARIVATSVMNTLEAAPINQTPISIEATPTKQSSGNFSLYIPSIDIKWEVRDLTPTEVEDEEEGHYGIPPELLKVEEKLVRFPMLGYPGYPGLIAIAGHRDILGAPFFKLDKLIVGDYIFINTRTETIKYIVTYSTIVEPDDSSIYQLLKVGTEELRLVTCLIGSTRKRLVIFAERKY